MVQYYCTDWDFIVSRAEKNGMLVIPDDGELKIRKPTVDPDAVLSLVYGATVLEFEVEMDAQNQFTSIKSKSWDSGNQEIIEADAENPDIGQAGNLDEEALSDVIDLEELKLDHGGQVSEQELQAWADAAALKSTLSKIRGRVKCQGFSEVKPGNTIEINGIGERFSGLMFVSGIAHQFSDNTWTTDIYVGLSPKWFSQSEEIIDTQAAGLLAGINGLQIGIVTDLEDPDGEDRVKVRLPILNPNDEGIWSRVATLDAGENRGAFFRPEMNDEVVVGFLNDDPRDAIVLGMLNSSAKPAPITASNNNHEKGFVTRSEMKVIFNDDEVSSTIETPNGNKFVLSDNTGNILVEDENGNKIELSSAGILVESASDLTLKASGEIKVESGVNMTLSAGAQFKAEGSAGAELSTGAVAVVQGSMVQIN
jgi:Rhs element Vgr protein